MMNRLAFALAATAIAASPVAEARAGEPEYRISDTSFTDPLAGRVQQLTLDVPVPVAKAWAALTTDEGLRGWVAPIVHIDLMNGGMMEASYSAKSHLGDRENIRNQIVAYVPGRMIVYHNVHVPKAAPADFALLAAIRTVITIAPLDSGHTRLVESGVGYGEGPGFDALYKHFAAGNAFEFKAMAEYLLGRPVDWKAEAAKAEASAGVKKK